MRKYILPLSFLLVFILPNMLLSLFNKQDTVYDLQNEYVSEITEAHQMIYVKDNDNITEMKLDTYVLGVLLGEMPAEFELEALKAQAVATRTYTLRKVLKQNKHEDANVCTDASCCQAFVPISDYISTKGSHEDLEKMERAVSETAGQVLTYQGNLIEATYFSCSGGMTEDAVAVWGTSVPYLRSVASPGEEDAKYFENEFSYSKSEFLSALGLPVSLPLSAYEISIVYTAGGGVDQLCIADKVFDGTQVRALLGLPSTAFTLSVNDAVLITTKGNGHRVGMSQYGAEAMAIAGSGYDEILAHYYPGTKLETYASSQMQAVFDKAGNL